TPDAGSGGLGSAEGVERADLGGDAARGDLLGEQLAGRGAEHDAPHSVTTGDVNVRRLGRADQRQTVGGDRAGADPLVLTVVEVETLEHLARLRDDRLHAPRLEGLVGTAELHGAGDAEAPLVGG